MVAPGTDLSLRVDGRTWINSDGRRNIPSGEVFTGPHEDSANGTIRFTVPTSPRGVEVSGVQLSFRDGKVVELVSLIDSFNAVEQVLGHPLAVNDAQAAESDDLIAV